MSANAKSSCILTEGSATAVWYNVPKRYLQAVLASLALFIISWMRSSFFAAFYYISEGHEQQTSWSSTDTGWMDYAFTWGFMAAQIPGALLTIRLCSHRTLLASMLLTTVFHLITPLFLYTSQTPVVTTVRFLQGIAEGPIFPACTGIWRSWAPPSERTTLFSIVLCGSFFGSVAAFPINTLLANNFGAKACFFISGISALIWCLTWTTQTYESPSSHPYISHRELAYLEENVDPDNGLEVTIRSVPWMSILKSPPVWAICLANFSYNCGLSIVATSPHLYYMFELKYEEEYSALGVLLPHIILGVVVSLSGFLADLLVNKVHLSRTVVRKLYCSGALVLHGIAFLIMRYDQNIETTVICAHFGLGILGLSLVGFSTNCLDLSPCYASVVMAFSQIFGNISDTIISIIIRFLVFVEISRWDIVFAIFTSVSFIIAVIYAVFGSANVQRWGKPETSCSGPAAEESARSTYYSYPDGADCEGLILSGQQSCRAAEL